MHLGYAKIPIRTVILTRLKFPRFHLFGREEKLEQCQEAPSSIGLFAGKRQEKKGKKKEGGSQSEGAILRRQRGAAPRRRSNVSAENRMFADCTYH